MVYYESWNSCQYLSIWVNGLNYDWGGWMLLERDTTSLYPLRLERSPILKLLVAFIHTCYSRKKVTPFISISIRYGVEIVSLNMMDFLSNLIMEPYISYNDFMR